LLLLLLLLLSLLLLLLLLTFAASFAADHFPAFFAAASFAAFFVAAAASLASCKTDKNHKRKSQNTPDTFSAFLWTVTAAAPAWRACLLLPAARASPFDASRTPSHQFSPAQNKNHKRKSQLKNLGNRFSITLVILMLLLVQLVVVHHVLDVPLICWQQRQRVGCEVYGQLSPC